MYVLIPEAHGKARQRVVDSNFMLLSPFSELCTLWRARWVKNTGKLVQLHVHLHELKLQKVCS